MALVLYEHPLSAFAQKIKLALYEKELPFEARTIDLFAPLPPEFVEHSPRRQVPVLLDFFGRATGELAERLTARAAEQLARLYGFLTRHLGTGPFFHGEQFGWADLAAFPFVASAELHGLPPAAGSPLGEWFQRASARPSAHKTLGAARAVLSQMPELGPLVAAGVINREYRDHRLKWFLRSGGGSIVIEGMSRGTIPFSAEIE